MAILNPSDFEYYIVAETVAGTTPAEPALIKTKVTEANFTLESGKITSAELGGNRAAGDSRAGMKTGSGSMTTEFKRATANDLMLASALSGTWSGNVLKANKVDTYLTVAKKIAPNQAIIYTGAVATSFSLEMGSNEMLSGSFEFMIMDKDTSTDPDIIEDSTIAAVVEGVNLTGIEAVITIAGLSVDYRSASLSVNLSRDLLPRLGSNTPAGIGVSGNRETVLSVEFYREDLSPDLIFDGSSAVPFDISVTVGSGVNGYTFRLPRSFAAYPQDSSDGSAAIVTVEFTASNDPTQATDLMVTKLT